jgi:hypothetical protein
VFSNADLDGRMRVEDSRFADSTGRLLAGTYCPTLVDVEVSGFEGYDVGRFRSYDGPLSCANFGERLTITDSEASAILYFEGDVDTFRCVDCELTGNTADFLMTARSGDFTFEGGSLASNPLYTANTAALYAQSGGVALTNVDLGSGADENPGPDIWVASQRFDGEGITTVVCTDAGCE